MCKSEHLSDALDALFQLSEQQEILKLCADLLAQCCCHNAVLSDCCNREPNASTVTHKRVALLLDGYLNHTDCYLDVLAYALKRVEAESVSPEFVADIYRCPQQKASTDERQPRGTLPRLPTLDSQKDLRRGL